MQFHLLTATTTDERMAALERFIEFWYGPRRTEFGESEVGTRYPDLPAALRRYYAFAGPWPMAQPQADASYFYEGEAGHHLFRPAHLELTAAGRLRFFMEYQGDWYGETEPGEADPPVWITGRWDLPEPGEGTRLASNCLSRFLVTHTLMTTLYEDGNTRWHCHPFDARGKALVDWFRRTATAKQLLWEVVPNCCPNYDGSMYLGPHDILVHDTGYGLRTFVARNPDGVAMLRRITAEAEV
jgi:hypothetical protein